MTRKTRADKDTKNDSVIAGLRMEPALKTALREYAKGLARERGVPGKASVAAAARHLLRVGLGWTESDSLEMEAKFTRIAEARRQLNEEYI